MINNINPVEDNINNNNNNSNSLNFQFKIPTTIKGSEGHHRHTCSVDINNTDTNKIMVENNKMVNLISELKKNSLKKENNLKQNNNSNKNNNVHINSGMNYFNYLRNEIKKEYININQHNEIKNKFNSISKYNKYDYNSNNSNNSNIFNANKNEERNMRYVLNKKTSLNLNGTMFNSKNIYKEIEKSMGFDSIKTNRLQNSSIYNNIKIVK